MVNRPFQEFPKVIEERGKQQPMAESSKLSHTFHHLPLTTATTGEAYAQPDVREKLHQLRPPSWALGFLAGTVPIRSRVS